MRGQKHLIKCRCILTQFKNKKDPPLHHFIVFSEIDSDDKIRMKYAQCNNCGIIHKVTDICVSEIVEKKENSNSIITIDDIRGSLNVNIANLLDKNQADLATWEYVKFIIDNKLWDSKLIISSELNGEQRSGKLLTILGESLVKVDSFSREEFVKDE